MQLSKLILNTESEQVLGCSVSDIWGKPLMLVGLRKFPSRGSTANYYVDGRSDYHLSYQQT